QRREPFCLRDRARSALSSRRLAASSGLLLGMSCDAGVAGSRGLDGAAGALTPRATPAVPRARWARVGWWGMASWALAGLEAYQRWPSREMVTDWMTASPRSTSRARCLPVPWIRISLILGMYSLR